MAPLLEGKLRFSDVVYAVETSPKSLRNWLQREQVELISERPESGWQRFSMGDVALLALVRHLVRFGIWVESASRMARTILEQLQGIDWLERDTYLNDAVGFSMFWTNRAVLVYPEGDEGSWQLVVWDMWTPYPADAPDSAIILKPEQILLRALTRAATGAESDDAEWESPETIEAMGKLLEAIKSATPSNAVKVAVRKRSVGKKRDKK